MMNKIAYCCLLLFSMLACNAGTASVNQTVDTLTITVNRFDKTLLRWIEKEDSSALDSLYTVYPDMLDVLGKAVLNLRSLDPQGFMENVRSYYAEPTLLQLYKDADAQYTSVDDIEKQLGQGFSFLKVNFPDMTIPRIYMHVSGFYQNVLVADSLLSLSIDKYMGEEFPLYQQFFYGYQRIKMQRARCVVDYLAGWMMSEFPFTGKENVLLDRMIYQGKIQYILSLAFPEMDPALIMGYTQSEYQWCVEHEGSIWRAIVQRKHLFTPDKMTTDKYFEEAPSKFLADGAPGNIGAWVGWQIVKKYMAETNATLVTLVQKTHAQEFLNESKYKPE